MEQTQPTHEEWLRVAKDLCNDLPNDVEDCANRLERYANDNNLTLDEVEDMCWENSSNMFNEIY